MCGIVGYVGNEDCLHYLIDSLKRLEYRGYDSAGIASIVNERIFVNKTKGKIKNLEEKIKDIPKLGNIGIAHTRWATHGSPSDENAHPHVSGKTAIVHNGIIENYKEIKALLKKEKFSSETDSEVIAHLIQREISNGSDYLTSVFRAINKLKGSFAIAIINEENPERIIVAKRYSPLIIGVGENANFVASDIPALISYTNRFIYLEDMELAEIMSGSVTLYDFNQNKKEAKIVEVDWNPTTAEKGGYKHFMQKEIFEQARVIMESLQDKFSVDKKDIILPEIDFDINLIDKIYIIACGTSYHAGLVGKFLIEKLGKIPVTVDLASEFRYRNPIIDDKTLVIPISQSGETADTIAATVKAKENGAKILSICNVYQSSLARKSHTTIYTHAGPEIGVASTKAFTTQIALLYIISAYIGKERGFLSKEVIEGIVEKLILLSSKLHEVLKNEKIINAISKKYFKYSNFLYLGRGVNYPIALEGALKLKEISYIHAEGYAAGEMKHGPIALIDENMPVIIIIPNGESYDKTMSNLEEVRARGGIVIAVATLGNDSIRDVATDVIYIPDVDEFYSPILSVIPLQMVAYKIALLRGTDVDQPRNLAKSVTVE